MAMQKIPTVEQSLLCTSIYINNYKRVIEELVYNSLDAAASSIAIRVCIQENFIQVLDNGNGILKDNFSLLGQKYATSKYVDIRTLKSAPDKYGYKGMSLASIIDVSRNVQIISQCGKSDTTWMKTFANGIEKEVCKTISRPSNGTTVEIKGFLYNLNIQRRSIEPQNELLNIKTSLQQLSLVHCNVSISLRDDCKNEIILQIHKNRTIHDTLQSVFKISEKYFQELQVEKNEYKVKAFINKHNLETNNDYQYIYINGKYIHKSVLHRTLNESLSHFISTGSNRRKYKVKILYTLFSLISFKNNCFNRTVPFYFVFITCPNYDFDVTYNSEKTLVEFKDWNEINKLIDKLIKFYNGGLVSKKRDLNEVGNEEKKSNLKTEVKKIMNCILNNKSKQTRISQLQNGIKGKIRKRSRKKKKAVSGVKLTNKNNETYDPCQKKDYPDSPNVEQSKDQPEKQEFKLKISKNTQVINYAIKVSNQQVQKIEKPPITFQKNKDLLIKQFDDPTKTVRKRCKYLNRRVLKLLDKNVFKDPSRSGFCLEEIEPSIMSESIENRNNNCKPGNYIVQESESDNAEHIIEPINCCETILRSCNNELQDFENEFENSMSPIAKNHCKLQNVYEFNDGEVYYEDTIYKHFVKNVLINTEIFEPEVQNIKNLFLKRIEKINSDIQDQDADLIFDSLSLTEAKILGQIDRKFIASIINARSAKTNKSSNYLVLFDQHAVDERVRLESNLSDYIQDSGWKSIHIDPVTIVLCKDDYVYCVNHKEKLARFGLQWTFSSECEMLLNAIPNAILGKNPRQVEIVMKAVKKLISEQIQAIKSLRGNVSLYPKSIMELVFSEACKYAIKFGDKLSNSECANMISSLAGCKTPFQCAHGRPAIAVLMELRNNYNQSYKVNLTKIKTFKKVDTKDVSRRSS
ncbi:DNA mismatch repair protein Mlh3-like [Pararge aegeria]|uniref:DNA mismatch repair protein Mlh3-like n=1 Tax=Pararge aegeria TaxID=116150 RepID=UPI0019D22E6B|nr:DNA mismatch repair protein Mlh3-like [Pararge aegeria]